MAHYKGVKEFAFADFHDRAASVAITAVDIIADRLEDEPDKVSTGQALEIVKALADRTGHAPVQKNVNTNVQVDLTAKLTAARARVQALRLAPPSNDEDG